MPSRFRTKRQRGGQPNALMLEPQAQIATSIIPPAGTMPTWGPSGNLPPFELVTQPQWLQEKMAQVAPWETAAADPLTNAPHIGSVLAQINANVSEPSNVNSSPLTIGDVVSAAPEWAELGPPITSVPEMVEGLPPLEQVPPEQVSDFGIAPIPTPTEPIASTPTVPLVTQTVPPAPPISLAETVQDWKVAIQDAKTFMWEAGADAAPVILEKVANVIGFFKNLPATASEVLDMHSLLRTATVALEGNQNNQIMAVLGDSVQVIREKANEAIHAGRLAFQVPTDPRLENLIVRRTTSITEADVARLQEARNDFELRAILDPKFQHVANSFWFLGKQAEQAIGKGGEYIDKFNDFCDTVGRSALQSMQQISGTVGDTTSGFLEARMENLMDAKNFLQQYGARVAAAETTLSASRVDAAMALSDFALDMAGQALDYVSSGASAVASGAQSITASDLTTLGSNIVSGVRDALNEYNEKILASQQILAENRAQTASAVAAFANEISAKVTSIVQDYGGRIAMADATQARSNEQTARTLTDFGIEVASTIAASFIFSVGILSTFVASGTFTSIDYLSQAFVVGTDFSYALYTANESLCQLLGMLGILWTVEISVIFFGRYLHRKFDIPSVRNVVRARLSRNRQREIVAIAELDDGTSITRPLENPDDIVKTAAAEGALTLSKQPPLQKNDEKLAVASTASAAVVNAVLNTKSEPVQQAVRLMIEYPEIAVQTMNAVVTSPPSETTIPVSVVKPSVTMLVSLKKDPLRVIRDPTRIAKVVTTSKKYPKSAIAEILNEAMKKDQATLQAIFQQVPAELRQTVASIVEEASPVDLSKMIEQTHADPVVKEVAHVIETAALVNDATNVRRASAADVETVLQNVIPEARDEARNIIQNASPVDIARIMAEPHLHATEVPVQQAVQTLALIPVAERVKREVERNAEAAKTVETVPTKIAEVVPASQAIREEIASMRPEIVSDLLTATPVEIAQLMVQPAQDSLQAESKSAVTAIATEMSKVVTRLQAKDVVETVEQIATLQVARNAVEIARTDPGTVQATLNTVSIGAQSQVAQLLQQATPQQIAVILSKPETTTNDSEVKTAIQSLTTDKVVPLVADAKAKEQTEIAKATEIAVVQAAPAGTPATDVQSIPLTHVHTVARTHRYALRRRRPSYYRRRRRSTPKRRRRRRSTSPRRSRRRRSTSTRRRRRRSRTVCYYVD